MPANSVFAWVVPSSAETGSSVPDWLITTTTAITAIAATSTPPSSMSLRLRDAACASWRSACLTLLAGLGLGLRAGAHPGCTSRDPIWAPLPCSSTSKIPSASAEKLKLAGASGAHRPLDVVSVHVHLVGLVA